MGSKLQITKRCGLKPATIKLVVVLTAMMLDSAIPQAQGASCTADADARPWTVIGDAATDADLSGAACASDGQCLLVSDEKRRAWFFRLNQTTPSTPTLTVGD